MAGKLQKFQTIQFQGWAKDISKQNNLGMYLQLAPQKANPMVVELLAVNYAKNLDVFLSQFAVKEFDNDSDYTWDVIGSTRRNIPLAYAIDENGAKVDGTRSMIGVDKQPFELVFDEEWFFDGELDAIKWLLAA